MLVNYLDEDPHVAARCTDDMRTAKLCTEAAQLLCGHYRLHAAGRDEPPYGLTHVGHPYYDWLDEGIGNVDWLLAHARGLYDEHLWRFDTEPRTGEVLDWLEVRIDHFAVAAHDLAHTPPPLLDSMPDAVRQERNRVVAYRIHAVAKPRWRWRRAEAPSWWRELAAEHNRRFVPDCRCEGLSWAECCTCASCGRTACPRHVSYDLSACAGCDPDAQRTEKPLDELTDDEVHAEVLQRFGYGTNDERARREREET